MPYIYYDLNGGSAQLSGEYATDYVSSNSTYTIPKQYRIMKPGETFFIWKYDSSNNTGYARPGETIDVGTANITLTAQFFSIALSGSEVEASLSKLVQNYMSALVYFTAYSSYYPIGFSFTPTISAKYTLNINDDWSHTIKVCPNPAFEPGSTAVENRLETEYLSAGGTYYYTFFLTNPDDSTILPIEPESLKISFSPIMCSVTYNLNGGTYNSSSYIGGESVPQGSSVKVINEYTPWKEYYNFVGWRGDDGVIYYPGNSITLTEDLVLTAIFNSASTYTYNGSPISLSEEIKEYFYPTANGNYYNVWARLYLIAGTYTFSITGNNNSNYIFIFDESTTFYGEYSREITIEKNGYYYLRMYDENKSATVLNLDITKPSYKITFDTNGGSSIDSASVDKGKSITLPTPTKYYTVNYSGLNSSDKAYIDFRYWLDENNSIYYAGYSYTPQGNTTLTAVWSSEANYISLPSGTLTKTGKIKYSLNAKVEVTNGSTINNSITTTTAKSNGYWYNSSGTYIGQGGTSYKPTSNITLYTRYGSYEGYIIATSPNIKYTGMGSKFLGWSTTKDDISNYYEPGEKISTNNSELTLYGAWTNPDGFTCIPSGSYKGSQDGWVNWQNTIDSNKNNYASRKIFYDKATPSSSFYLDGLDLSALPNNAEIVSVAINMECEVVNDSQNQGFLYAQLVEKNNHAHKFDYETFVLPTSKEIKTYYLGREDLETNRKKYASDSSLIDYLEKHEIRCGGGAPNGATYIDNYSGEIRVYNITLSVQYTIPRYTLVYYTNDATSGSIDKVTAEGNSTITLSFGSNLKKEYTVNFYSDNTLINTKYSKATLQGWNINNTVYSLGASLTLDSNKSAIAVWSSMPSVTLPTPTKANAIFLGWYTQPQDGTKVTGSITPTKETTSLYAHWKTTYKVSYDANTGDLEQTYSIVNIGDSLTLPTPTKNRVITLDSNYKDSVIQEIKFSAKFLGWYKNNTSIVNSPYTPTGDDNLVARWEYESVSLPEYVVREKFRFMGWYLNEKKVSNPYTPQESTTLYAHWIYVEDEKVPLKFLLGNLEKLDYLNIHNSIEDGIFYYTEDVPNLYLGNRDLSTGNVELANLTGQKAIATDDVTQTAKNVLGKKYLDLDKDKTAEKETKELLIRYYEQTLTDKDLEKIFLYKPNELFMFQFRNCFNLTKVVIPSSVTNFGWGAFYGCINLLDVMFEGNIESISGFMFTDCSNLITIDFSMCSVIPTLIDVNAFEGTSDDLIIKVPAEILDAWKAETNWNQYADKIVGV